ncbi:MAG: hypothetical protein OXC82_05140 [Rhodobacteraceae bacterium]|nr:hypothetical protein [Paracoccaceae bacterium]MCY4249807.1 hypothetical protein [Paracoccaceae bacterium]
MHAGFPDGTTVLSTLPEGIGTTGAQKVHVEGNAAGPFPRHPQRLGNPLPFAVGQWPGMEGRMLLAEPWPDSMCRKCPGPDFGVTWKSEKGNRWARPFNIACPSIL